MQYRFARSCAALVSSAALVVAVCATAFAADKDKGKKAGVWKAPRTEFGHPDLQGNWSNATLTALERPQQFKSLVLSPDEAASIEGAAARHVEDNAKPTDPTHGIQDLPKDCGYGFSGTNCGYNNFWVDRGTQVVRIDGKPRSSFITHPESGRIPALTDEARQRMGARMAARRGAGAIDGPEMRSLGERCLMSFGSSAGPPMLPLMYNNTYSIAQTKDHVMILVEMVHDARIIRLDGKRGPKGVPRWMGESVGRWEGETLVVETTNFHPLQSFRGSSPDMKVTERFTRTSADQIMYQFTVEDPSTWAQPWGGELPMNATADLMYEYACHEGNYALPGILAGAREEERVAGGAASKKSAAEIAKELEGE
jgi:hypothetical protein